MNAGQEQSNLADIATIVGRGITPKYSDSGATIVLNQKCVRDGKVDLSPARLHDSLGKPVKPEKLLRAGDVLVNSTGVGTLGRTAPVRDLAEPTTADSHITIVRPHDGTDPIWLGYVLAHSEPRIEAMAEGSTGQTELSRHRLAVLPVDVPSIDEQRRIGAVLKALDDKIDSNRRVMDFVLQLGSALFKHACGEGTSKVLVDTVAQFHNRRRVPLSSRQREARPGPYPYYGATGVFGFVDDYLFDEDLVLVGEDGSVVKDDGSPVLQYIWGKSWINNHAHPLTGRGITNETLFLALTRSDIRPLVTGAVQPKVSMGNLKSLHLELPNSQALEDLEDKLAAIFAIYRSRADENRSLAATKKVLLPELMSGRIRPSGAVDAIEEVLV